MTTLQQQCRWEAVSTGRQVLARRGDAMACPTRREVCPEAALQNSLRVTVDDDESRMTRQKE